MMCLSYKDKKSGNLYLNYKKTDKISFSTIIIYPSIIQDMKKKPYIKKYID